jgi:hypothetical protein
MGASVKMRRIEGSSEPRLQADETLESAALAGAAAIQRIIAERDSLRSWASSQQREITSLRNANEDLRRRMLLARQCYVELATRVLDNFEQFDGALREAPQDSRTPPLKENDTLIDLAQRLSPTNRAWKADAKL